MDDITFLQEAARIKAQAQHYLISYDIGGNNSELREALEVYTQSEGAEEVTQSTYLFRSLLSGQAIRTSLPLQDEDRCILFFARQGSEGMITRVVFAYPDELNDRIRSNYPYS